MLKGVGLRQNYSHLPLHRRRPLKQDGNGPIEPGPVEESI